MDSGIYKTKSIKEDYVIEKELGKGSFATVYKGKRKSDGLEVGIKVIDKQNLESEDQLALQTECEIMCQIDHPNIVKLFEVYDNKRQFFIILELMTGGELFDRIVEKEFYNEKEACDVIKPIVDAIGYLHSLGFAHRDLKPENLLYSSDGPDAMIKLSDFGMAKVIQQDLMTTACGTPSYVAPEIIKGKGYTKAVDYWSIGVILYVLLCGFPPFYDESQSNEKLFELIKTGKFDFPSPHWDCVSASAKDLIKNLLKVDPNERFNAQQIMNHPWIKEAQSKKELPNTLDFLRKYNAKRRLRKGSLSVIAVNRLKHMLTEKK